MAPADTLTLLQQAVARHGAGALDEADALYLEVLRIEPDHADGLSLRGALLLARGDLKAARVHAAAAVARAPGQALFHSRLGSVELALGHKADAAACFEQAVALDPSRTEAYNNLGLLCRESGDPVRAEAHFRHAIQAGPHDPEAYCNLGGLLQEQGALEASQSVLQDALRLRPDYVEAHLNLGNTLRLLGRYSAAEDHLRRALALQPSLADGHNSLGLLLRLRGEASAARAAFEAALTLRPVYEEARANLNLLLQELGLWQDDAAGAPGFDRDSLAVGANRMTALLHDAGLSAEQVAAAHRAWGRKIEAAVPALPPHAAPRNPGRRLRIGLLTGDMRRNPAFHFTEPVLRHIDRARYELIAYAHLSKPDQYTDVLIRQIDRFQDITRLDDDAAAALIRADEIDLLIVATGYFEGGRVGVAARAPAPRMLSYPSYPATLGLSRIGWRLTDNWCDPPGESEHHYAERLLRVAGGHLCYAPPEGAPDVAPAPFRGNGHVTFGSFSRLSKLNPHVLDTWAGIMRAVPDARLYLKTAQFRDAQTRERMLQAFVQRGVAPGRLRLEPFRDDVIRHLVDYGDVDIVLDPFPYSGQTTTCEALWMGAPVIAMAGDSYVSRVCGALLTRIGHPELVAKDADDYGALAVDLARDPSRMEALRAGIRPAMAGSTLGDPAAFAPRLAAALDIICAA